MTISSLKAVLTPDFINKTAKIGTTTNAGSEIAKSISGGRSSADLGTNLRTGARNFALGVQALNVGISYLQVSKASHEKLLNMAEDLNFVIKSAADGSQPTASLLEAFARISKKFETNVRQSKIEDKSVLDIDELSTQLKNAGLDPEKTDELSKVFKKMVTIGDPSVSSVTEESGELPPEETFRKALSRARVAFEDGATDGPSRSEFFSKLQSDLGELKEKISQNIESLDSGIQFVGKNLNLVRAAGLAFLDASGQLTGSEQAETVAANLQAAIRAKAKSDVGEAKYLTNILQAGIVLLKVKGNE